MFRGRLGLNLDVTENYPLDKNWNWYCNTDKNLLLLLILSSVISTVSADIIIVIMFIIIIIIIISSALHSRI